MPRGNSSSSESNNARRSHSSSSSHQTHSAPPSNDPTEIQRRREVAQPFDLNLSTHIIFNQRICSEILIHKLERDDAFSHQLNFKYIDLQIQQIIIANQVFAQVYFCKSRTQQNNNLKFH